MCRSGRQTLYIQLYFTISGRRKKTISSTEENHAVENKNNADDLAAEIGAVADHEETIGFVVD